MSHGLMVVSIMVLLTACMGQDSAKIDANWAAISVGTILYEAQASGSLVYSGRCGNNGQSSDFPKLRKPRNKAASVLQILREMFADDARMEVTQETGGRLRMVETDVPLDLLDLKIQHLSFTTDPDAFSSANEALWVILRTPEVKHFMADRNIGPPLPDSFFFSIPVPPDTPHISGDLQNVTVSQALDYVLKTYPGFWTYENCPREGGGRTVFFNFFPRVPPSVSEIPMTSTHHPSN